MTSSLLLCGAGTSRAADSSIVNGQLQLGDVLSGQILNVEEASDGVAAGAVAVGNIVSATGQQQVLNFQSDQTVAGHVEAAADVQVNGSSGPFFSSGASATGNSATAGTCCALTNGVANQTIQGGVAISADSTSRLGGATEVFGVDSSAIGNTVGWEPVNGQLSAWSQQTNAGSLQATNAATIGTVYGNTALSSTAVANNVTVDADNSAFDVGFDQSTSGPQILASTDVQLGQGSDVQVVSTGVGNNVDAQAAAPDGQMNGRQVNSAPINVYANLDAGSWSGDANTIAYGVGNSVVLSNSGPHAGLWSDQTSTGDVTVGASFTGGAGANVFTSATAQGNAVSGYACSACGGALDATNNQVGSARVRASSNVRITGGARAVTVESNAVGNTATYQVTGSGN